MIANELRRRVRRESVKKSETHVAFVPRPVCRNVRREHGRRLASVIARGALLVEVVDAADRVSLLLDETVGDQPRSHLSRCILECLQIY